MPTRDSPEPNVRKVDPQFRVSLPDQVRQALKVGKDDFVAFTVEKEGVVRLRRARLVVDG